MRRWPTIMATIVISCGVLALGGLAFIYSGVFDVAATSRHWSLTEWILETARTRSVKARAADIKVPPNFDDPAKLPMGVEHFAAHCAICHGGPGVPKGDIGNGLNPPAPDLAHVSTHYNEAELFWIIKNGIKMTGMPAWADHDDQEIWATVAFLKKLPGMTPEEYGKLVMAAMAHGGQHPHGNDPAGADAHGHKGTGPAQQHDHAPRNQ